MAQLGRIGLMGLGRIGRNIFRLLYDSEDLRIEAVSDVADHAALAYLLRFDTLLGRFPAPVTVDGENLIVAGRQVRMFSGAEPGTVPWGELGVDTVIEATARFRTRAEVERHLQAGARRVILCSPPADPPDITVVEGVNDSALRSSHRVVSNASSTAHAAAPVLKLLHEAFGIRRAFLTTVHAYTNQQRLADVPAADPRRGRAAAENIIPQETNSAQVVMELLPELRGKLTGLAINVPVANGSVVDLVCWHEREVTKEEINQLVREASASPRFAGILGFEDNPIVSSDILRNSASGVFDSLATMVLAGNVSKTLTWFDNGWGYSHRVVDLIRRFREIDEREEQDGREEGNAR
ncbi:MAG TPA: glyceraldehyde 3-phosphate dehydrogenase NAD-binding domain-containing protein [Thermoanaerobaculia bacterium]|nr:glyceraldehyde 3-phosphate dehydrogenase NAD-binding domain-containing protein [Thermoanaerobaculia bacterium]